MPDTSYLNNVLGWLKGSSPVTGQDAMPFGVAGPAEPQIESGAPALVGGAANTAYGLMKNAVDAANVSAAQKYGPPPASISDSELPPQDPLPGAAFEAAKGLAMGGAPAAERGAAGIFGGRLAKTADLKALQEAQQMYANGMHPNDIYANTGWFAHPADNKWRFEIPDNNMRLNYMPDIEGNRAMGTVDSLVHHPELLKAYPDLRSLGAAITKDSEVGDGTGFFTGKAVHAAAPDQQIATKVMAHELQHGVQGLEGFSAGASIPLYEELIKKGLRRNPSLLEGQSYDTVTDRAYPLYRRTAGEVEAYNVENRLNMTPQSRLRVPPWYTHDVPYSDQLHHDPVTGTVKALRKQ